MPETSFVGLNQLETSDMVEVFSDADASGSEDIKMLDGEITDQMESIKRLFVEQTKTYDLPQLERLYTRIMKGVFDIKDKSDIDGTKQLILKYLLKFAEDKANF